MVTRWQDRRAQVAQAKHEANLERIRAQAGDWKDEFLVVLWSVPIVSCFVPPLQEYAFEAVNKMGQLPEWYLGGFVVISLSVFGVNKIPKLKK